MATPALPRAQVPGRRSCRPLLGGEARPRGAEKATGSPRPELPAAGWGQKREHQGRRRGLPGGSGPQTQIADPSSRACPRDATPGRGRPPAPRIQSLARSHGVGGAGDELTRRDACSPRRHGGGASSAGAHPRGAPPVPAAARPRGAGRRVSPPLGKEIAGRSEAGGAREGRGGESGAGVPRGQDHDSRLGRKHFCSQTRGRPGKPSVPGPCLPGRPQPESSTAASREVRCASSHRNMGTLKIHATPPVHYV